jgi:hypothetical protein
MKPVFWLAPAALALLLIACGLNSEPVAEKVSSLEDAPSTEPSSQSQEVPQANEAFLHELLEAQLKSAAKLAREGKLESAIRQIEVSQRVFPDIPELQALHTQLVQRREEAIRQQIQPPVVILNRSQLPPADRIAFSLITADWNATFPSESGPAVPYTKDLQKRIADFIDQYPDFVEARLLQARLGLTLQDRHEKLLKALVIMPQTPAPTEGPEAGAKLAQWQFDKVARSSPEISELIDQLKQRGWYRREALVSGEDAQSTQHNDH